MGGAVQSSQRDWIAPAWMTEGTIPLDLTARVVYFPVRHHSPACAWHIDRLIRDLRPDAVLIEGPRDASPLLPLILHKKTRFPVELRGLDGKAVDDNL